jgi:hypothetical protein
MKRSFARTVVLAASLAVMPYAWAQTDLQEGLWEISVTMTIGGQPASAQPLVMRQCIAQQSAQEVMSQLAGAGTCETADLQQEGNRATWKVMCSSPVEIDAAGSANFRSDSFDGVMSGQLGMSGQTVPFSQNFQARRVGDCQ